MTGRLTWLVALVTLQHHPSDIPPTPHPTQLIKDRPRLVSTIFIKVFLGLLVGSVWYGTGKPLTNDHIFTVEGAMFCCVFMSTVDTLMATLLAVPGIKGTSTYLLKNSIQ